MLNLTCTISRPIASVVSGSLSTSLSEVATGVPCAIQVASGAEASFRLSTDGIRALNVWFPVGTDAQKNDVLSGIYGDSVAWSAGAALRLDSPPIDPSGRGVVLQFVAVSHESGDQR